MHPIQESAVAAMWRGSQQRARTDIVLYTTIFQQNDMCDYPYVI